MSPHPAVFLDRDGVLNEVVWRAGRPASPRHVDELRLAPDAAAVATLRQAGLRLFIVSNQPDVARGLLEPATLDSIMERVRGVVPCDDTQLCTHDDRDGCACRKPRPGMLHELAARWHVDLDSSFMVGDGWRDVAAGKAAGCRTILLRRRYNESVVADMVVSTLSEAVDVILATRRKD